MTLLCGIKFIYKNESRHGTPPSRAPLSLDHLGPLACGFLGRSTGSRIFWEGNLLLGNGRGAIELKALCVMQNDRKEKSAH